MEEKNEDVARVSQKYAADVLVYCGTINPHGDGRVIDAIVSRENKASKNIHLILNTDGGDPDSAYKIARCIRRHYGDGKFTLAIGWHCKSAGTLIALGADEIVMSDGAELGPIDMQVLKPDEILQMSSGLGSFQALDSLREYAYKDFEQYFVGLLKGTGGQLSAKVVADIATKLAVGMLSPVYSHVDPMRLAEDARALLVAAEYGKRLKRKTVKDESLDKMIRGYPAHSFVIDIEEAKELFQDVRTPCAEESTLLKALDGPFKANAGRRQPFVEFTGLLIAEPARNEEGNEATYELPAADPQGRGRNAEPVAQGNPGGDGKVAQGSGA